MRILTLSVLAALLGTAAGARAEEAKASAPKIDKAAREEMKKKGGEFRETQKAARMAHHKELKESRDKFKESIKNLKDDEKKAAKEKFRSEQEAKHEAFKAEQKTKREGFLKENPELAGRWHKHKERREAAKERCKDNPEDCKGRREGKEGGRGEGKKGGKG